jgi:hypothetical protein
MQLIDITGHKFGKLTVIRKAPGVDYCTRAYWECVCDCGGTRIVNTYDLRKGPTKSCGCVRGRPRKNKD